MKKGKSVVKDIIALIKVILYNVNKFKRPWRCGPHGVGVTDLGPRMTEGGKRSVIEMLPHLETIEDE